MNIQEDEDLCPFVAIYAAPLLLMSLSYPGDLYLDAYRYKSLH